MQQPKFWNKISLINILLYPLSIIYYFFYKLRILINLKPYKSTIPIICIGNLTIGGNGKTPICIEISKYLKGKNKSFCFLSKGYKGKFKNVLKLDKIYNNPKITGDESILLNNYGDTFISKNRLAGLKYINNNFKYDYIIMDDGLQNPTFYKNKKILVVDGINGFGNNLVLPGGPLRDKVKNIKNIDLLIIIDDDLCGLKHFCVKNNIKYINSKIKIIKEDKFFNKQYVAFCGIGKPEKFKKTLLENRINFVDFIIFPDHFDYSDEDIINLKQKSEFLITTEKDWVKLSEEYKKEIDFLKIEVKIDKFIFNKILN